MQLPQASPQLLPNRRPLRPCCPSQLVKEWTALEDVAHCLLNSNNKVNCVFVYFVTGDESEVGDEGEGGGSVPPLLPPAGRGAALRLQALLCCTGSEDLSPSLLVVNIGSIFLKKILSHFPFTHTHTRTHTHSLTVSISRKHTHMPCLSHTHAHTHRI